MPTQDLGIRGGCAKRSLFGEVRLKTTAFILGCGHSGTSLLANMFAARTDVFIPLRETGAFLDAAAAPMRWEALRADALASGKPHLVEKTPGHVRVLPLIRAMVPGARFIAMMRDGRDVAASFIKRFGAAEHGRRRWLSDNAVLLAEAEACDVTILRYEDLIADPERALRSVCTFLDFTYDSRMLDYHRTERRWFDVPATAPGDGRNGIEHRMLRNWQINQPLFDGRGLWKDMLTPEDAAAFEAPEAQAIMAHFGYV